MRTYIFEGTVTALTSVAHNGGEQNGITSQLRREKFVQPDGRVVKVPVVSGNSIRGIIRDAGMLSMLRQLGYGVDEATGQVVGLPLNSFYFLFSGGSLTSTGATGLDIDAFRKMKKLIPLIGVFGGAAGNTIMPGKLKVGKLIPICKETAHLLPNSIEGKENLESIWEYCQTEMYTRRDDAKNDRLLPVLQALNEPGSDDSKKPAPASGPQQMMYRIETLAAGTRFYWKVVLEDVIDVEFEAFLNALLEFSRKPNVGGKSAVGHGEISIKMGKWIEIDSRMKVQGQEVDVPLMQKYTEHLQVHSAEIRAFLNAFE